MISTLAQYQMVTGNLDRSLKTVAADPTVERQSEYYLEHIRDIKTIDDFLSDDRIYRYAMKAMGLGEMTYAKAFMRKILEEGSDDRESFANRLADKRYLEFAKTFNFKRYGNTATSFARTQQGIADAFLRQTLEEQEGASNEGVRLALYFERKASGITNAYDILADRALSQTVYTALGLPQEFALSDIDKQAKYLEERMDIKDLSDPAYVKRFLSRFSALYDLDRGTAVANVPNLVLGGGPAIVSMDQSLLASIQNFKLGGS